MRQRDFIKVTLGSAAAWPLTARAQTDRVRHIGVLMQVGDGDAEAQARIKVLRDTLQQLGWMDGRNIAFANHAFACRLNTFAKGDIGGLCDDICDVASATTSRAIVSACAATSPADARQVRR
jgi:hypothetical protein